MTSFWAAQHWHGNTNQPLRQTEWLNATLSSPFSPSPSLYHSHTVCLSLVPLCHFSCTLSPIFSSHIYFLTLKHFVRPMLAFSPFHFPLCFQSSLHFKCLLFIRVIRNLETFRKTVCPVFAFEWIMMWWEIFLPLGEQCKSDHMWHFFPSRPWCVGVQYDANFIIAVWHTRANYSNVNPNEIYQNYDNVHKSLF